ncbi:WD40 repeat domain-containing protein [Frigoriglobus tundricola]|uniref:Uncharacterized protein n=1 Tax=Frigoriglobus tundricola TaxID=2774151 RepID=A0A6M5Z1P7_9BACT|nr:WD40 repeat domain-containing protein [Frigoriglobus tundricola]QJW99666.1 hypothetical protein FTUN_7285 [Frigoriglobus tundricola]
MSRVLAAVLLVVPAVATAAPPAVTAIAYSPNGEYLALGLPGEVRLFDAPRAEIGVPISVPGRLTALAFHPIQRWIAVAHGDAGKSGLLGLHPIAGSGSGPRVAIEAHRDAIYALAFSPDGRTLATAGYDRVIHLWDLSPDAQLAKAPRLTLKDHSDAIYGLSFHPDGKLLASAGADRAVKVWDTATGKRLYTLSDATDWVYAVAWSPDKKHLAASGVDKSLRVWAADAEGGKLVGTAFAHEKPVWRLAYSADGSVLYTAGEDRIVKSWDAGKLAERKVYATQPDAILDFALRPDGKQFALARFDGAAVVIDTAAGKAVAEPLAAKGASKGNAVDASRADQPKVETLSPSGATRGTTVRVRVSGTNLGQVTAITANVPDVRVRLAPVGWDPARLELDVTIGAAAPVGAVPFTFTSAGGKSTQAAFAIDRYAAVQEVGNTDSARTAMPVKLPVTVLGVVDRAGDVDYFRFVANAGDQIGVQTVAAEVGSKLDSALVLTDDAGTVLADGTTALGYTVRRPGTYAIGIRDREFRGGPNFTYRLHIGDVPVVTGVFPLAVQRGRTASVHVSGVNLAPGATVGVTTKVSVPADAVPGSKVAVALPDTVTGAVGKAEVTVSEFPAVVLDPATGGDIRVPGSADGILTKPNEAQTAHFAAKRGERLIVEVLARRAGSPVDSVIEILDPAGKPVPVATLRCTAKTHVTFRDHDSGSPGIRLDAWNELGIDDYLFVNGDLMRILELPKGPDDDCEFYQTAGRRVGFLGTTPAHHSMGLPMYKVELHPPGKTFPPNGMPVFTLNYRNDDGGPGYGKDSCLHFDPPADGTYQVRVSDARGAFGPAHAFRVTVRPPRPGFTITANVNSPSLLSGGAVPIDVTVSRTDGFDGRVDVALKDVPTGFTAPATFVEAGQNETAFGLYGEANAALPTKPDVKLVASATIGGKEVTHEIPLRLPMRIGTGEIATTVREQTVRLQPGKETRFTVDIARQGKFAGRVPLEVKGLPHGVRVLNVGLNGILVTERETSREVVLYAEPWVKPMDRPIVVFARREGADGEFAAKPLTLRVEK